MALAAQSSEEEESMASSHNLPDKIRREYLPGLIQAFPFPVDLRPRWYAYRAVMANCLRLLPAGARILDFGAGSCDKAAMLSRIGYRCTAVDDLQDDWHRIGANRERLRSFARSQHIDLIVADHLPAQLAHATFDMVMLHDVIEHFADSPRSLLLDLIGLLRAGGYLYITVPNAVNLRKRLMVLSGRTNYPRLPAYFWSGPSWRGHKREYVKDDLALLCQYLGLQQVLLQGQHHRLNAIPSAVRSLYVHTVGRIDSLRDTLAMIGRKPSDWSAPELTEDQHKAIRQKEVAYELA
jgi:SAM-dependent methyltransferase